MTPYLFAGASGSVAVACALLAATLWRRAAAARAAHSRLKAQLSADMTAERVFLLRHDRVTAASPATEAYVRDIAYSGDKPEGKLALRAVLGDESTALLAPLIRLLLNEGERFTVAGRDAAGSPWRFIGETVGARAVLRLLPLEREQALEADLAAAGEDAEGPVAEALAAAEAEVKSARMAVERWRSAAASAPVGLAVFGGDGRLRAANDEAMRLWRLDQDLISSRPSLRSLLDALRNEGRIPERADYAEWRAAVIEDPVAVFSRESRWPLPNGDTLQVTAAAAPDGGFTLYVSDETSALGLNRRYAIALGARRAMVSALDVGLAVVGGDGGLQLVNPSFAKLWDLDPGLCDEARAGETSLGAIAAASARDAVDAGVWARIDEAASTAPGGPRRGQRFTATRGNGLRLEIQVTPLPDGATLIACADVTGSHRAEMALREKAEALEAADQLKTEFLNDIAHQLRTPLNAVIGFADMLRQGVAGEMAPKQAEYLDDVLDAADDLRELISDALDLGKLRAGAVALRQESVELNRVALNLASIVGPRAKRQGVTLETAFSRTPLRVTGDESRLKHALFSAASAVMNAAHCGDRLRLSLTPDGDAAAVLSLRLDRRSATPIEIEGFDEGGGVALSLARRIAELHGGEATLAQGPAAPSTARGGDTGYTAQASFRLPLQALSSRPRPMARKAS